MTQEPPRPVRDVYCVLSAHALPYAGLCLRSLLDRSVETLRLALVTDDESDRVQLQAALAAMAYPSRHTVTILVKADVDRLANVQFAPYPHLLAFREGHPCWRKITDPLLLAEPGAELVILDPDLYFPNDFCFEQTPAEGVLLMWQPPSCLLPHEVVLAAYDAGIPLAHHVDIGVAHARKNIDLAWLDSVVARLGGSALPRLMHVEAIVWAAMAMRLGGGYLNPGQWKCWQNPQWKRLALKLGLPGRDLLRSEPFDSLKCFHAGGAAKGWLPDFVARHRRDPVTAVTAPGGPMPFEELTRAQYDATRRLKRLAAALGYYRWFAH